MRELHSDRGDVERTRAPRRLAIALLIPALAGGCAAETEDIQEVVDESEFPVVSSIYTVDGWMSLEDAYVPRVCTQENGAASYEALKAQAVAARTYLLRAMRDDPLLGTTSKPVPNGQQFQAYAAVANQGCINATNATRGIVGYYQNTFIIANYVAGAFWVSKGVPGSDPTGTEHWVTYNEGLTGSAVHPTPLSYLYRSDNRGCMSQNGSNWLAQNGYGYTTILRYFYGADLALVNIGSGSGENVCAGKSNGYYCGGNGIGGDPMKLYLCSGGAVASAQSCSSGCKWNPPGVADACWGNVCAGKSNGYYCGGNTIQGNVDTLYYCSGGAVSSAQYCSSGCEYMPPGVPDQCN